MKHYVNMGGSCDFFRAHGYRFFVSDRTGSLLV